jgi:hypothetical protein
MRLSYFIALPQRGGEVRLRIAEDFEDRLPIGRREGFVPRVRVAAVKQIGEARVDRLLRQRRQRVERFRVDQVTERVPEQPAPEI